MVTSQVDGVSSPRGGAIEEVPVTAETAGARAFAHGPTWRFDLVEPAKAVVKLLLRAREVKTVRVRAGLARARVVAVLVAKDEADRVPALLTHYRRLGVEHFLFLDNGSTDDLQELLDEEDDVSVFRAEGSYKRAHFGNDWVNLLIHRHCRRKWVLYVDCDEHLVYDRCEELTLADVADDLEARGALSMPVLMVDMYGADGVAAPAVPRGESPLTACPYYDTAGYVAMRDATSQVRWVKGGPRYRTYFSSDWDEAPALNKVPFVRATWRTFFLVSACTTSWSRVNRVDTARSTTGVLLHFRFLGTTAAKLTDTAVATEHTAEYQAYQRTDVATLHGPLTARYTSPADLVAAGLMTPFGGEGRA